MACNRVMCDSREARTCKELGHLGGHRSGLHTIPWQFRRARFLTATRLALRTTVSFEFQSPVAPIVMCSAGKPSSATRLLGLAMPAVLNNPVSVT